MFEKREYFENKSHTKFTCFSFFISHSPYKMESSEWYWFNNWWTYLSSPRSSCFNDYIRYWGDWLDCWNYFYLISIYVYFSLARKTLFQRLCYFSPFSSETLLIKYWKNCSKRTTSLSSAYRRRLQFSKWPRHGWGTSSWYDRLQSGKKTSQKNIKQAILTITCLLILLIGFSRLLEGEHFVTDVIGGILAGSIMLVGMIKLDRLVHQMVKDRKLRKDVAM